jgi:hypothetical protein
MKNTLHLKLIISCLVLVVFAFIGSASEKDQARDSTTLNENKRWPLSKANEWYAQHDWLVGCNFIPSTAINTLEMWQETTFDPNTIDKELGWAQNIGFNSVRVFLHYLLWGQDSVGFEKRLSRYLDIASKHGISTMFVLFDDCWNGSPKLDKQPAPVPGVHNSGWVQCPGQKEVTDITLSPVFERYVKGVITHFKNDKRILMWDLYNEPGNSSHGVETLPLLKKVFLWAREAVPSQPITADYWNNSKEFRELNQFQIDNSDIITFHNYENKKNMESMIDTLREYGRPQVCTEYMRRPISTFNEILPLLKRDNIGAYNWGLVSGKTQTIYPWDSWKKHYTREPKIWFHDIFRKDGTPYDKNEIKLIKNLTVNK